MAWVEEIFGSQEGFDRWYEDYGGPGGYEFSRAGYESWLARARAALDIEHRGLVVAGGGYLPGDPRLVSLGPATPTPLGGSSMIGSGRMNGGYEGTMPVPPRTGAPATNGVSLGPWLAEPHPYPGAITLSGDEAVAPAIAERVNGILVALGASAAQIAVWLPRIAAAIAAGMAIWAAIQMVTGRAPPATSGGGDGSGGDVGDILQGPFIPEPRAGTYSKTWMIATDPQGSRPKVYTWFWKMLDGSIVYYSTSGKSGKYRPKKPAAVLMAGGATSLKQAVKAQRILDRMWRTVAKRTKQLKLA